MWLEYLTNICMYMWQARLEEENQELRGKVMGLQADLDISEGVQRDFVKLSQTLQMELEKIRQQGTEVRWQHEDDVSECGSCRDNFLTSNKTKVHCSHCGQVFCQACCSKVVFSGPRQRPYQVCATPCWTTPAPPTSVTRAPTLTD
ncbi:RABEP1 [Cordylochernes scorpioides]|uniref:RABEP1 n=1 Tax=Cordylochernes scorpioides TaxID=51811 RepID=A0ABY6LRL4_9ARAC|nr:RABEP1 [Cordylochernes scorpioides]